jgi:hypothetical protein
LGYDYRESCDGFEDFDDIYEYQSSSRNFASLFRTFHSTSSALEEAKERVKDKLGVEDELFENYVQTTNSKLQKLAKAISKMQKDVAKTVKKYRQNQKAGKVSSEDTAFIFAIVQGSIGLSLNTISNLEATSSDTETYYSGSQSFLMYQPFEAGMDIGRGLNSFSEIHLINNCLQDFELGEPVCMNEIDFDFEYIENIDTFKKTIGMSLKGEIGFDLGVVSGSAAAKASISDMVKSRSKNFNINVNAKYKNCTIPIKNPQLTSEMKNLYFEDKNAFRRVCGDKFMTSITVGGEFIGIGSFSSEQTAKEIYANITLIAKGEVGYKYLSFSFSKSFDILNKVLTDLSASSESEFLVVSNGSKDVFSVSLQDFTADFKEFLEEVNSEECRGGSDYNLCNYKLGNYQSYDALLGENDFDFENSLKAAERLAVYYKTLKEAKDYAIDVRDYPENYSETDLDLDTTISEIEFDLEDMESRYKSCLEDITYCSNLENLEFKSLESVTLLPTKKIDYPQNCIEAKEYYTSSENMEYLLYFGGDLYKPMTIFCDDMESETPTEYLRLFNSSPIGLYPRYNFTKSLFLDEYGIVEEYKVRTYRYLKLFLQNDNIYISPYQDKFVEEIVDTEDYKLKSGNRYFGEAENFRDDGEASANINLSGTGFQISEDTLFSFYKRDDEVSENVEIDASFQEVDISLNSVGRILSKEPIKIVPK